MTKVCFSCGPRAVVSVLLTTCLSLWAPLVRATNRTWTGGGGADNNWMTPANWQGGIAPVPGDNLIFQGVSNAGNSTNHNNFPAGTVFGEITISTAANQDFALGGNTVVLTNGIAESAGGLGIMALAGSVYFDVTLGANQAFTASHLLILNGVLDTHGYRLTLNDSGTIRFNGAITNTSTALPYSTLVKTNNGTASISSATQYTYGEAQVAGGALVLNGDLDYVELDGSGTSLSGTGYSSIIDCYLATVTPGSSSTPGQLSCDIIYPSGIATPATFEFLISGTTPGAGYSQLQVFDSYQLTPLYFNNTPYWQVSAGLMVSMSYTSQIGDFFVMVTNASAKPYNLVTNGIFYDLPPASVYDTPNGYSLGIGYDNKGATLTTIRNPGSPFVLWKGSGYVEDISDGVWGYFASLWSSTNNWAQGVAPGNGSRVQFTSYQFSTYPFDMNPPPPQTNDLPAGLSLASLLFSGTNYTLYGNAITVTEGITNQASSGTNVCNLDLATTGPVPIDVESGGTLRLGGGFAGSGTLSKEGGGTLIYAGTTMNSFVGTVVVGNGNLLVDGSFTDGSFTVNGGLLGGAGTISSVTMNGGVLKPGDSPGILHLQGNLNMAASAAFQAELNGPIPGSGYDQLQVNGSVSLNGATLNLQPGYAASPGAAFLILVNDGTDPIAGTFAGLPEGAVFLAGGQYFSITYRGGSGANDVVVTRVNPPARFTNIQQLSPGVLQIQGLGTSNATYAIQANTNLTTTNWLDIGAAPADGLGEFLFNVSNVVAFPERFFRAVGP